MTNSYRGLSAPPGGTITIPPTEPQTFLQKFLSSPTDFSDVPLIDQVTGGFRIGAKAFGNIFTGKPIDYGTDKIRTDIQKRIVRNKEGKIISEEGKEVTPPPKKPEFSLQDYQENQLKYNKQLMNQALIFGGMQDAADKIGASGKYYTDTVKNMMNQTTGTLASLSQGQKALAATLAAPITPIRRMGYYG
tara:strand:- start:2007 stop:2576 length:570 start_codon:yes stop_codon:yes gene_type:complete